MVHSIFPAEIKTSLFLPFYLSPVAAGFPSPADDYIEKALDLNQYLIKHPSATFFVKVKGDSMINAGIFSGDILIVDRSVPAHQNKIIVAILNGEFTVKRFKQTCRKIFLIAENPNYLAIEITKDMDFEVWGVVINVIRNV